MVTAAPVSVVVAAVLFASLTLPHGSSAQPVDEGVIENISVEARGFAEPRLGVVWTSRPLGHSGAKYLRLRLSGIALPARPPLEVEIVAEDGTVLEKLGRSELEGRSAVWSKVLSVSWVRVRVRAEERPDGLRFTIDKQAYSLTVVAGELSLVGTDGREEVYQAAEPDLRRAAAAVAKLSFVRQGRPRSCTGFLISEKHFVTNEHCIADQETCDTAIALFGYQKRSKEQVERGPQYRCSRFVGAKHDLDYAVIELVGRPGDTFGRLDLDPRPLLPNDGLIVVQHPGGKPKKLSRKGCVVRTSIGAGYAADTDFGHECDTEGGSSGSPVLLAANLKVVGLHHLGRAESGRWKNQNRAVRMEVLVPELTLRRPEGAATGKTGDELTAEEVDIIHRRQVGVPSALPRMWRRRFSYRDISNLGF